MDTVDSTGPGVISLPYNIHCPSCQQSFVLQENLLGKLVRCRNCNAPMQIPEDLPEAENASFLADDPAISESRRPARKKNASRMSPTMAIFLGGMLGGVLVVGCFLIWKLFR